jgi:Ankyrin repeats (3 copies)
VSAEERYGTDWMTDLGVVLATTASLFAARIVCEQTLLTWTGDLWMTGLPVPNFALDWIGLLCAFLGLFWAIAIVSLSIRGGSRVSATNKWLVAVMVLCCGLWLVPAEPWKLVVLRVHGTQHVPRSWVVNAAASGEIRLLDYLLAAGADPNIRAANGQSALGAAAAAGQTATVRALIARGAHVDSRTRLTLATPLTEAAQMNQLDMVRLLLERGADVHARDIMGRTALDWARANCNADMAQLLQARSASHKPSR